MKQNYDKKTIWDLSGFYRKYFQKKGAHVNQNDDKKTKQSVLTSGADMPQLSQN